MRELGRIEGKDYVLEHRRGDVSELPRLAAELVASKVDLLVTPGTPQALAAKKATSIIPIVTVTAGDPVGAGIVASLARPGGNVTGLSSLSTELTAKRLDIVRQVVPDVKRIGFLYNPDTTIDALGFKHIAAAGEKMGIVAIPVVVRRREEVAPAFEKLARENVTALHPTSSFMMISLRTHIIDHAMKYRLPAIYGTSLFVEDGGLLSYSANWADQWRRAAGYVDRIFKGAKPGDLPIEQPTQFELVVNLKTAKALGITIPQSLLLRADRVIE
jgi:putative ABC transport system substrate-binding protein